MTKFNFTADPKKTSNVLNFFLDPENIYYEELSKDIFQDHPVLKEKTVHLKDYVLKYYRKNNTKIVSYKGDVENSWKNKWSKVQDILSEALNMDWLGIDEINCNVGIARIYPRDLKKYTLQVCFLDSIAYSESVILHEITHFLYFKKWKSLFSGDNFSDFEAPHPFWHLSEIVAPLINNDNKIIELIPQAEVKSYKEHDDIFDIFKDKYLESKNIEDFLRFARKKILELKT